MSFGSLLHLPSVLLVWTYLTAQGMAQTTGRPMSRQFQWQFTNDGLGASLPTCLSLGIRIKAFNPTLNDTYGIAPFYMIAYAVGGTPTTTLIGTDNVTLSWAVTHPVASELILNVVDSTGSSGGIPPRPYTVIAGQTTQCVSTPATSPEFTVTSNVTGDLQTCQPWGLTIKGGVPPYNLSLAAVNSPVVTNVTIPYGFDAFTYINRADPGSQMIAAISDLTGRWATGTPLVNTKGSSNVDCIGLVSASGNSTILQKEAEARKDAANKKRTALIAGITVPVTVVVLSAIAFGVWFFLRRRKEKKLNEKLGADLEPRQFDYQPTSPNAFSTGHFPEGDSSLNSNRSLKGLPPLPSGENGPLIYRYPAAGGSQSDPRASYSNYDTSDASSSNRDARPHPPFVPVRRTGKAAEAAQQSHISPDSEYYHASGSALLPSTNEAGEEVIIQHRDGGTVRELPPPYADPSRTT